MSDDLIPNTPAKQSRSIRNVVPLSGDKKLFIYAGKKISDALKEISKDMPLYHGVRLSQVLEAAYEQGKKDGARSVFEQVDGLKGTISHRNPGQPKKMKKPKVQKRKKK